MKLVEVKDRESIRDFVYSFGYESLRKQYVFYVAPQDFPSVSVDDIDNPTLLVLNEYEGAYSFLYKDLQSVKDFLNNILKWKNKYISLTSSFKRVVIISLSRPFI